MTRDEIILMADASGISLYGMGKDRAKFIHYLEAFAKLVAKHTLLKPEQEPVAWMDADGNVSDNNDHKCFPIPLYTKEQP